MRLVMLLGLLSGSLLFVCAATAQHFHQSDEYTQIEGVYACTTFSSVRDVGNGLVHADCTPLPKYTKVTPIETMFGNYDRVLYGGKEVYVMHDCGSNVLCLGFATNDAEVTASKVDDFLQYTQYLEGSLKSCAESEFRVFKKVSEEDCAADMHLLDRSYGDLAKAEGKPGDAYKGKARRLFVEDLAKVAGVRPASEKPMAVAMVPPAAQVGRKATASKDKPYHEKITMSLKAAADGYAIMAAIAHYCPQYMPVDASALDMYKVVYMGQVTAHPTWKQALQIAVANDENNIRRESAMGWCQRVRGIFSHGGLHNIFP